jgi:hypothetical protein
MKYIVLGLMIACGLGNATAQSTLKTSAQEVSTPALVQQREALKKDIVRQYLALKQNLIVSDSLQAAKSAGDLAAALTRFKFKKLTLQEMNAATTMRTKLADLAKAIARTTNINVQRKSMMELSEGMWTIMDKIVPEKTVLYQQTCPMAGKVWISESKEIKNPYFPKNMLTCGAVTASIGE